MSRWLTLFSLLLFALIPSCRDFTLFGDITGGGGDLGPGSTKNCSNPMGLVSDYSTFSSEDYPVVSMPIDVEACPQGVVSSQSGVSAGVPIVIHAETSESTTTYEISKHGTSDTEWTSLSDLTISSSVTVGDMVFHRFNVQVETCLLKTQVEELNVLYYVSYTDSTATVHQHMLQDMDVHGYSVPDFAFSGGSYGLTAGYLLTPISIEVEDDDNDLVVFIGDEYEGNGRVVRLNFDYSSWLEYMANLSLISLDYCTDDGATEPALISTQILIQEVQPISLAWAGGDYLFVSSSSTNGVHRIESASTLTDAVGASDTPWVMFNAEAENVGPITVAPKGSGEYSLLVVTQAATQDLFTAKVYEFSTAQSAPTVYNLFLTLTDINEACSDESEDDCEITGISYDCKNGRIFISFYNKGDSSDAGYVVVYSTQ